MKQSGLLENRSQQSPGLHLAIIMDGNGRWATGRGLPRTAGHQAGVEAVRQTIEVAVECEVAALTLYAFSADNWKRPVSEVRALMQLFRSNLAKAAKECVQRRIRLSIIGRRDRLPNGLRLAIETAEKLTRLGDEMHCRIAIDYSSRAAIAQAPTHGFLPDVDLLIRTSGEQRLSDFLLWECAYAELYFTNTLWPDFGRQDLITAINTFHARHRRFGSLLAA